MAQEMVDRIEPNFAPSIWGDQFLNYTPDTLVRENYCKEIEVLKGEVKGMMLNADEMSAMSLIDTLQRLGISYHFQDEIDLKMDNFFDRINTNIFNYYDDEMYDLYTVALHFRLLRHHGYRISSGVSKFRDGNGKFEEALEGDARGLLSLYEAAHLRVHAEVILEDALVFATSSLKSMAQNLQQPQLVDLSLRKRIEHALMQPLHFGVPRIETRCSISFYEEDGSSNESLLLFAKLDYNLLQMLHRQEMSNLSRWWKEVDLMSKLPYARDRLVECYFWAISSYYEPQYSHARVILTKTIMMTSIIDDTYDSYGTVEELQIFNDAIQRWNISEIDRLPDYMKPLYEALLELYEQFEQELLNDEKSNHELSCVIEAVCLQQHDLS